MNCKYCRGTKIWTSPIMGGEYPCEECKIETTSSNVPHDEELGVINEWGTKLWKVDGKPHRENGPAKIWPDGDKEWWLNGQLHRADGPAIDYGGGAKQWYLNGIEYTEEEWKEKVNELDLAS